MKYTTCACSACEIVAVQAFSSHATRGFHVEDTVAINLRFASDAFGTFMLSDTTASARRWEQTSQENKAYPSYPDEDCYVIAGTFGSLSVPTMRMKTYAKAEDRSWWKPFETSVADEARRSTKASDRAFWPLVRGQAEPIVSPRDGLQKLRITEAIVEAAKTGAILDTTPNTVNDTVSSGSRRQPPSGGCTHRQRARWTADHLQHAGDNSNSAGRYDKARELPSRLESRNPCTGSGSNRHCSHVAHTMSPNTVKRRASVPSGNGNVRPIPRFAPPRPKPLKPQSRTAPTSPACIHPASFH